MVFIIYQSYIYIVSNTTNKPLIEEFTVTGHVLVVFFINKIKFQKTKKFRLIANLKCTLKIIQS